MLSVKDFLITTTLAEDNSTEVFGMFTQDGLEARLFDETSKDPVDFVLIRSPELLKNLFSCVPAYGGSKYLYHDKVKVGGKMEIAVDGRITLTDLRKFVLFRKGETYKVI